MPTYPQPRYTSALRSVLVIRLSFRGARQFSVCWPAIVAVGAHHPTQPNPHHLQLARFRTGSTPNLRYSNAGVGIYQLTAVLAAIGSGYHPR